MDHSTLLGHIAIFSMQVAGLVYQWLSEGRQHRWQTEQRKTLAGIRSDMQNGNGHVDLQN